MRTIAVVLLTAACGRFGFDAVPGDGVDGGHGRDAVADELDAIVPPPLPALWVTTSESLSLDAQRIITRALDGGGFTEPCPEMQFTDTHRFLLAHPSLPYVYGVEQRLDGIALDCDSYAVTSVDVGATSREVTRAVLDVASGVGFFAADGVDSVGVFRFIVDPGGAPAGQGSADAPALSGPLVLEPDTRELYVAGRNELYTYALDADWQLPAAPTIATAGMCAEPRDLLVSEGRLLVFCSDSATIVRYARATPGPEPLAPVDYAAVVQAVALPRDRAATARRDPPALDLLDLRRGDPVVESTTALPGRARALAASPGGDVVIAAIASDATTTELIVWQLVGHTFVEGPRLAIPAVVTGLAVTSDPP